MAQGTVDGFLKDTDVTLAADSNLFVPSQHAVKTYVDALVATSTPLSSLPGATYSTVQDFMNAALSSGMWTGGNITISGTANAVDVAAGTGFIRAVDSDVATVKFFDWAASPALSVPSNTTRYIGVIYNGGSPIVVAKTTNSWDVDTEFPLGVVVNEGGTRYITAVPWTTGDTISNIIERLDSLAPISRDNRFGGIILSDTGTRNIAVSAGILLSRLSEFDISVIDTATSSTFDAYYRNGAGGFTKQSAQTQWNNSHYDNGTGTLAALTAGFYTSRWFYVMTDGSLVMLYGRNNDATLAIALNDGPPTTVPDRVSTGGLLIGRLIIQNGAVTPAATQTVFTTEFSASSVTSFSDLSGTASPSQGGTGVVNNDSSTITIAGAFPTTLTLTGATSVTLPTSGLLATTSNTLGDFAATTSAQLASVISDETGTGALVFANSPALVTPNLGTPSTLVLTNATGLSITTGVAGLGSGVATFLGTPSSTNLAAAVTDETGTGALVFATSPTLVTPNLGTPSAIVLTNATGTAAGVTAGTVTTNANLTGPITSIGNATSVAAQTGTGSTFVMQISPTLITPNLGTPTALVGTNITGTAAGLTAGTVTTNANLTGAITSVGNATSLGSFSSANLAAALTDETGTGAAVFANSPIFTTPNIGSATGSITGSSGSTTGNAATATALQTARTINGISFDGTANITVTAAAGTLTGTTLNPTVVNSSLTSVGTLADLTVTNPIVGSITGNAGTVTTNANLTGAVTSVGNATSLGSFSSANLAAALTDETGAGAAVFANSPTLVTPNLDTPSVLTLTNATGLPVSTGISGLGTGIAAFLATPSSANLAAAVTNETGTGALVFATSPTLVTPALGTPSAVVLTNATGLPVAGGGTGAATFTDGGVIIGNGTGALQATSAGTTGQVLTSNGAGVDPTFQTKIPSVFTSADQTITSAGLLTLAHGLGTTPQSVRFLLVCQTAEFGYTAGDITVCNSDVDEGQDTGLGAVIDATNIRVRYGARATVFKAANFTTGARQNLTNANWKLRVVAVNFY